MSEILWELTSDKVISELKNGRRLDGRALDEYRKITVEKNISQNADGSARVRIGETEVICGVKLIIGEPYPDSPDEGSISVGAELLALASPEFEVGPPNQNAIELARVVDRGIRESKTLNFKDLCIDEEEKKAWIVFIDFYILNDAGNLFDASSLASIASLLETRIPKLENGKIVKGEYNGKLKLSRKPVLSTFAKISNHLVLDPITAEEKAMDGRFSLATNEDNLISAFQKGSGGAFTAQEINEAMDIALKKSKELRKLL